MAIWRQHRQLLAALAAAPERIVSFPRGDLRRSATRLPSRWLLPSLRVLSGQPGLQATRWESVSGAWLDRSPSYAAGLATAASWPVSRNGGSARSWPAAELG